MIDLKPCPFCGHDVPPPYYDDLDTDDDYYVIKCPYCGVMMYEDNVEFLIVNWNRRVDQ